MKLKPYLKYKDSGIPWIGKIPEGWEVRKLKHICTKYAEYGLNISSANYQTEGIRFIRTTDIDDYGNLQNGGVYLNKSLCKGYVLNSGDLLISRSGTIGRTFLFDSEKKSEATYAGYLVRFSISKNKAMPKYVFYFTKTNSFYKWLEIQSIETTIENVNGQKYANLLLTIPPLSKQTVIANFLDKKTARIDALIEKDKKLIALLKEKRTALINHAVTKGLDPNVKLKDSGIEWIGKIPEGWEVRRIKQFSKLFTGSTPDSGNEKYWDGDITWITPADLSAQQKFIKKSKRTITREGYNNSGTNFVEKGAVILATRAPIGYPTIVGAKLCFNQGCKAIEIKRDFIPDYVYYYLNGYVDVLVSKGNVTTFGELSSYDLTSFQVLMPPLPEQTAIANYLDKATARIDKTIQKIEKKIELLQEYKKSLIHYVVTGKINVKEVEAWN